MRFDEHRIDLNWCKFFGMEIQQEILRTVAIWKGSESLVAVIFEDNGQTRLFMSRTPSPGFTETVSLGYPTVGDLKAYLPDATAKLTWLESIL